MHAFRLASRHIVRCRAAAAIMLSSSVVHCDGQSTPQSQSSISSSSSGRSIPADIAAKKKYSAIIVGGGTAGTTAAYVLSKWIDDNKIKGGSVLLIDRGVDFSATDGPDTSMSSWYDNWCHYGESHESVYQRDGRPYPVSPSDHRGLGGCSTHDTRITFQVRTEQNDRMAESMGWSPGVLKSYFQAALDMMPLAPSLSGSDDTSLDFYNAVISHLTLNADASSDSEASGALLHETVREVDSTSAADQPNIDAKAKRRKGLNTVPLNEYQSEVVVNSIAQSSLAMYSDNKPAIRWSPAYLMHDDIRPRSLEVITSATVDKVLFDRESAADTITARGVRVVVDGQTIDLEVDKSTCGEVALTSGALGNAAILQRSGLGPPALLEALGIPIIVANDEIGHGVDHEEIAVMFEWNERFNTPLGQLPQGGVMGWPLVMFSSFLPENDLLFGQKYKSHRESHSHFFEAHVGAGYAEPYTSFPSFVVTPSCVRPYMGPEGGFRVCIKSKDPHSSCIVLQGDHEYDIETIAQGVLTVAELMRPLVDANIVGQQLQPPFAATAENKQQLVAWIRDNHFTVYHWACTCQSGLHGRVADEKFRVRRDKNQVISNLRVGSAAALPELSEANPHLTVAAFAIALADAMTKTFSHQSSLGGYIEPLEILNARKVLNDRIDRGLSERPSFRRVNSERPSMKNHAVKHYQSLHSGKGRD